jgi:hypothetical protein
MMIASKTYESIRNTLLDKGKDVSEIKLVKNKSDHTIWYFLS